MTTLVYSIANDFKNATQVYTPGLSAQLNAVSQTESVTRDGTDSVIIVFSSTLSPAQITAVNNVIANYVYVLPIFSITSVFQAVVSNDPNNPGDFTTIAAAFAAGRTSVFVRRGTYNETSDVIIPNGGQLVGEVSGQTVVVFAGPYSIRMDGSGGVKQNAGTVSIGANSNTVTGSGTTFTALSPGQFILLGSSYHRIASVASDTQLTIADINYAALNNIAYQAQAMIAGCKVQNLLINSSTSAAIYMRAVQFSSVQNVVVAQTAYGIDAVDCNGCVISRSVISFLSAVGIRLVDCTAMLVTDVLVTRAASDGCLFSGPLSSDIRFSTAVSKTNGASGFQLACSGVTLASCSAKKNGTNGILITGNACTVSHSEARLNQGTGIRVVGNDALLSTNIASENVAEGVVLNGNNTQISCCQATNNILQGILINGNNTQLNTCQANDNKTTGIEINGDSNMMQTCRTANNNDGTIVTLLATNTAVICNNLRPNISSNFTNNGTATMTGANLT